MSVNSLDLSVRSFNVSGFQWDGISLFCACHDMLVFHCVLAALLHCMPQRTEFATLPRPSVARLGAEDEKRTTRA